MSNHPYQPSSWLPQFQLPDDGNQDLGLNHLIGQGGSQDTIIAQYGQENAYYAGIFGAEPNPQVIDRQRGLFSQLPVAGPTFQPQLTHSVLHISSPKRITDWKEIKGGEKTSSDMQDWMSLCGFRHGYTWSPAIVSVSREVNNAIEYAYGRYSNMSNPGYAFPEVALDETTCRLFDTQRHTVRKSERLKALSHVTRYGTRRKDTNDNHIIEGRPIEQNYGLCGQIKPSPADEEMNISKSTDLLNNDNFMNLKANGQWELGGNEVYISTHLHIMYGTTVLNPKNPELGVRLADYIGYSTDPWAYTAGLLRSRIRCFTRGPFIEKLQMDESDQLWFENCKNTLGSVQEGVFRGRYIRWGDKGLDAQKAAQAAAAAAQATAAAAQAAAAAA